MKPYYLVPIFLKIFFSRKMIATYILYLFPNFSSRAQEFRLDQKLGTSLLHDKLNFYGFVRDGFICSVHSRFILSESHDVSTKRSVYGSVFF